jgi:ABC-type lipoprotein release transport system permease subunit
MFSEIRIACLNLVQHRGRTALLCSAIAVVTSLYVLLSALTAGVRLTLVETATTVAAGHLNVGGFFKSTPSYVEPLLLDSSRVLDIVKRTIPEIDFVVERGRASGKVISDRGSLQTAIAGIDIDSEPTLLKVLKIREGRLEEMRAPHTLLLFEQQAAALDVSVGDSITISSHTSRGSANTLDCRVVAIAADVGLLSSLNVFIPIASLRELYGLDPSITGVIQIHVQPRFVDQLELIAGRLRVALEHGGYRLLEPDPQAYMFKLASLGRDDWTGQRLDVTTWEEELSFITWTFHALQGLSFVLMVTLVTFMIAGLTNALWIMIRERTREIGTLRAMGMQRGRVTGLFLFEGCSLGLIGATCGVALGALVTAILNSAHLPVPLGLQLFLMRDTLQLTLHIETVSSALWLMTSVAGAAAIYPSLRASRCKPVDAMAHFD